MTDEKTKQESKWKREKMDEGLKPGPKPVPMPKPKPTTTETKPKEEKK